MIDTLVTVLPRARQRWPELKSRLPLPDRFALVTMHRPANVDDPAVLTRILTELQRVSEDLLPVVFPVHPRTRSSMESLNLDTREMDQITFTDPLGYVDFLALTAEAALVVTDSGGIQEETTYLGTPCLTVRPNTERPITITEGTNRLVSPPEISERAREAVDAPAEPGRPEFWDGRTATRIVDALAGVLVG
jgi:UDP-N-acetylglucosamine 2-epimerase (non-hydrolysing)